MASKVVALTDVVHFEHIHRYALSQIVDFAVDLQRSDAAVQSVACTNCLNDAKTEEPCLVGCIA